MAIKRLLWACAALFVLFGLPLAVVEDPGLGRLFGNLGLSGLGDLSAAVRLAFVKA